MYPNIELQSKLQRTIEIMPDFSDEEKLTTKATNSNEEKDWWQATGEP